MKMNACSGEARYYNVYIDDKKIECCVEADDVEGWADVLDTNILSPSVQSMPYGQIKYIRTRLFGRVEFRKIGASP